MDGSIADKAKPPPKLQSLVSDILPTTTAIIDYAIGLGVKVEVAVLDSPF